MDESLKGVSTSVVGQDSREVEASESAEITVQRVRRSIQLLKRAFFSNNNLSDGSDPIASTSAVTAAQTKKSSRLARFGDGGANDLKMGNCNDKNLMMTRTLMIVTDDDNDADERIAIVTIFN